MPAYKDKKRSTWYVKFNYTDWTGITRQKLKRGFKTMKKAKAFEREFLEKNQAAPDMSFNALVKIYMEDCKTRLRPTTYKGKDCMIKSKLLPYFKNMQINTIEPSTVRRWQNELMDHENNYSQTYLKTLNNQLSAIFNFAMKYYKLPSNPARICGSMGKKNADDMNFWTLDEFNQFMDYTISPICTVIYQILFWTGIRIGECLALTLNDFDFNEQTLSINKNYARHNKQDLILEPKTPKSKRIITMPKFLGDIIEGYISKLYDYKSDERLFPIIRNSVNKNMKAAIKRAKVKKIRVHDLRHSHASLLIEMGFSPLLISERLGHENIETTLQTYSHLYPNKHDEVANKLQNLVSVGKKDTDEK